MSKVKKTFSLHSVIIIPIVAIIIVVAIASGWLIQQYLDSQRLADAQYRAEIIAYAIQYTAEIEGISPELNRIVQAFGTESDVNLINVILINSGTIIASNRFDYRGDHIDSTIGAQTHRLILKELADSPDNDSQAVKEIGYTLSFASSFLVDQYSQPGRLDRAAVIVDLNTISFVKKIEQKMQTLALILFISVIGIAGLAYLLLRQYIFKPLKAINQLIKQRAEGDQISEVAIYREDDIGVLGSKLNHLIAIEEENKRILVEREQELKLIFNSVPVKIWYKDNKNTILRLNTLAAKSMGRTVEQVEGKNTAELFPEMAQKYLDDDLEVINSGNPKLNIIEKYTPIGLPARWVKTDKVPYSSPDTNHSGVLVVAQDITELKHIEEKLKDSEERFQLVIQGARDGIWDWPDMSKDEQYWSPQWKALLGYEENEIDSSAKAFRERLHPDDLADTQIALQNHITTGDIYDVEYRLKVKGGQYKWFQTKGIVTKNPETGVQRMTGSITDIQTRKEAEIKMKKYTVELQRSNQDLDDFAYIASHDLKSPLRGIDQIASWMSEDIAEGNMDDLSRNITLMRGRVQRMEQLLTDLLLYSRVGRTGENLTTVDTKNLVQDLFHFSSPPKAFRLNLLGDFPNFKTYSAPLEQVLRNLIGNAIKHHDREDGELTIHCYESPKSANHYEFAVSDDGPGIDEKYHQLIFKMFKSLRPRDEVEGSGIGLALIKKIVHTYNAEIHLESSLGKGATFYFTWPKVITEEE